jgi:sulfate permease, SulP family
VREDGAICLVRFLVRFLVGFWFTVMTKNSLTALFRSKNFTSLKAQLTPTLWPLLRHGYSSRALQGDMLAGLTVALVALPLAMALAIASGATPQAGLLTAIIAGGIISLLGGGRYQIGGPTGAFVVLVAKTIETHGYNGLVLACFIAGILLIIASFLRFGRLVHFIPNPVIIGFTSGIALIIFSSQIKEFFGLPLGPVPADLMEQWPLYWRSLSAFSPASLAVACGCFATIIILRRFWPRAPSFLIALTLFTGLVWVGELPVTTLGGQFGVLSAKLPAPTWPQWNLALLWEILPRAADIALLGGLESLLCAVIADRMTGTRHRSDTELFAQGVANCASALFGGLPATGAIARTATNIRAGAYSPLAGLFHAAFLWGLLMIAAPLVSHLPLAGLAATLVIVAWNMSEPHAILQLFRRGHEEIILFLSSFTLTIIGNLTLAIAVGVSLCALFLIQKIYRHTRLIVRQAEDAVPPQSSPPPALNPSFPKHLCWQKDPTLPSHVVYLGIEGALCYATINILEEAWLLAAPSQAWAILDLRQIAFMDSYGAQMLAALVERALAAGQKFVLIGELPAFGQWQKNAQHALPVMGALPVMSDHASALAFIAAQ